MYFDEAVRAFEDSSIDLLHIDGLHTYEAVKHDYETWLPKVNKENGIILFHDVSEKSKDFGVYELWGELQEKYEALTFEHYHGLGVIFLNSNFLSNNRTSSKIWSNYYKNKSDIQELSNQINEKDRHIDLLKQENFQRIKLSNELREKNRDLLKQTHHLHEQKKLLESISSEYYGFQSGLIWKSLLRWRPIKAKLKVSLGRFFEIFQRVFSYTKNSCRLLKKYGLKEFLFRTYIALRYVKYSEYNRDYQIFLRKNKYTKRDVLEIKKEIGDFRNKPLISIIMPVYNVDPKWLKKAIESVKNQWYENWELCIADDCSTYQSIKPLLERYAEEDKRIKVVFREKNGHISEASNSAIDIATGEYIVLMDNDDVIHPQALYKIVKAVNEKPTVGLVYSDEDKMELNDTRCDPIFKSDYSPDYLLSTNYFCHLTTIRTDLIKKVKGFRKGFEGSQDYDLFLRVVELLKEEDIIHIPDILYSWRKIPGSTALTYDQKGYAQIASFNALKDTIRRRSIKGQITEGLQGGFFRIKYDLLEEPLVSIILVTEKLGKTINESLTLILQQTNYPNYEIVVVSTDGNRGKLVKDEKVVYFNYKKNFNISQMRNFAVEKSEGDYVVMFDKDIKVMDSKWLEELLGYAQRANTGAVVPKIISTEKEVLCTSFWLENGKYIKNVHKTLPPNMQARANLVANYSILSDLCFMISKDKYKKIKGFESYNNEEISWLDFFLKLAENNLNNVYTPYTEVEYSRQIPDNIKIKNLRKIEERIEKLSRKLY